MPRNTPWCERYLTYIQQFPVCLAKSVNRTYKKFKIEK